MVYADSTLFIFAAVEGEKAGRAQALLTEAMKNKQLSSSLLSLDEVAWVLSKPLGTEDALRITENYLASGIIFREVTREVIINALQLAREFHLRPRDAIHVATMRVAGETEIISDDSDFDRVRGIKRIPV